MSNGEAAVLCVVILAATVASILHGLNAELAGILGLALGYLGKGAVVQRRSNLEGST
jgi:hypothetical protein